MSDPTEVKDSVVSAMEMERIVELKDLKRVAEKNLNIVKRSKFDQKVVMVISVISFLFGIAFITLKETNKYTATVNIVINFLYGSISGGTILSNIKGLFESNADSIFSKELSAGPPVIDCEVTGVLNTDEDKYKIPQHIKDVRDVKKIIDKRNKYIRRSNIYSSIIVISGSIIAIVLVGIDIHYIMLNKENMYFYLVNVLLVVGGLYCLLRSISMHIALLSSDFFGKRKYFIYLFSVHLFSNFLIYPNFNIKFLKWDIYNCSREEKGMLEGNIKFFFGKLVLKRVVLVTREKEIINRLLHGLPAEKPELSNV